MRITFYQRHPQKGAISIERLFADILAALPDEVEAKVSVSRFPSRGICGRIYNVVEAVFRQGDVNHITGDIHFLALLLHKKRTLLTIHDLVSVHRLCGLRKKVLLLLWYWMPIKRAEQVTVISQFTKDDLLRHLKVNPKKIRVVHDCVSSTFQAVPKEFNAANPVVLQVGVGKNKNLERVVKALQGIPCHLRIIGHLSSNQTELLHRCGIEYSSVSNISDEQIVEEYCQCDMLIFASTYEGFGLPIVEAQATGRPVVTSNICSMPEVAGDAACLVDPFSVTSIREGILKVINIDAYREELVRQGFNNIKRFRAEYIAAQYLKIYRKLIDKKKLDYSFC